MTTETPSPTPISADDLLAMIERKARQIHVYVTASPQIDPDQLLRSIAEMYGRAEQIKVLFDKAQAESAKTVGAGGNASEARAN